MTELTEHHRKALTEYLGECWHEAFWHDIRGIACVKCDKGLNGIFDLHKTFTTPADLHAVYSRMVEKGEWDDFNDIAIETLVRLSDHLFTTSELNAWLFCLNCPEKIPARMVMAAEFCERRWK